MNRRQWIGSAVAAGVLSFAAGAAYEFQPDSDRAILAAIGPVMLGGALPADASDAFVDGFDSAVAGLTPSVQREIAQLMTLLRMPPTRMLVAGVMKPWHLTSPDEISRFLERWRYSPMTTLRSAYDALHQLSAAVWYGSNRAWVSIGYPGPPHIR